MTDSSTITQLKPWRWNRQRRLMVGLIASFITIPLGMGLYLYRAPSKTLSPPTSDRGEATSQAPAPCLSPACTRAAARLSASVNSSLAQPCSFFLVTCGAEKHVFPSRRKPRGRRIVSRNASQVLWTEGGQGRGRRATLDNEANTQVNTPEQRVQSVTLTALLSLMREILESRESPSPENAAEQKVRRFYRSCMDKGAIDSLGSEPVLKLIEKLGGWAVSGRWNQSNFNDTLSLLMKEYFTFPFFNIYVGRNPHDSNPHRRYIQIDQPELQIPVEWSPSERKFRAKAQDLRQFLASRIQLLGLLGVPSSDTNRHTGLFIQLSSELALFASSLHYRQQHQLLYQHMTVRELQMVAPAIDWLGCLRVVFHPLPVSESDSIILHNLPYIKHMSRTITKWQAIHEFSNSGTLHTFMILNLLQTVIPALSSEFTETQGNLSIALGNTVEVTPRWMQCVLQTKRGFEPVLAQLMRERVGEREIKELIEDIFFSIKSKLADLRWKDEKMHLHVLNKVRSLSPRPLPFTEKVSEEKLDQQYSGVPISEDDYFSNYLQSLSLQQKRLHKLFSLTAEADIFSVTPSLTGDEINVPMGMFVPPFFHPSYPRAVSYGALGTLIAQQILHLLLPEIQSQSEVPQTVSECIWTLYQNLTDSRDRDDFPRLTFAQQQEIWFQYTALQIALTAYHERSRKIHDSSLSGLHHTRLFFASFTQINCELNSYREHLPFESSFLVTIICLNSNFCSTSMTCTQKPLTQKCL